MAPRTPLDENRDSFPKTPFTLVRVSAWRFQSNRGENVRPSVPLAVVLVGSLKLLRLLDNCRPVSLVTVSRAVTINDGTCLEEQLSLTHSLTPSLSLSHSQVTHTQCTAQVTVARETRTYGAAVSALCGSCAAHQVSLPPRHSSVRSVLPSYCPSSLELMHRTGFSQRCDVFFHAVAGGSSGRAEERFVWSRFGGPLHVGRLPSHDHGGDLQARGCIPGVDTSRARCGYGDYHAPGNKFERFRGFLELISRFEFEFCRCENFIF